MNIIRRWSVVVLLSILFVGVSAQCVYEEGGRAFLDLTETYGMPEGSTTKTVKYTGTYIGSDTRFLVDQSFSDRENERMYEKLEIAKDDLPSAEGFTWAEAFDACREIGNNWRLPTQCELIFMWIFKEPLKTMVTPFGETPYDPVTDEAIEYWSATECGKGLLAWNIDFCTGYVTHSEKVVRKAVRCVRDVHP